MKLVDILARELKVWPEGVRAITQGGGSGVLRDESFREIQPSTYLMIADDSGDPAVGNLSSSVTRAQWQAAVDALKAEKVVVNEVYEVVEGCVDWFESDRQFIGQRVSVHHIFRNAFGVDMAVVENKHGECLALRLELLAEIRTPEQIAAEERDRCVQQMAKELMDSDHKHGSLYALYDLGYRKFEIVDN